MNWNSIAKLFTKENWDKYSWAVCALLLVYCAYLTFKPAEVKVIKTEHTKTVVDRTESNQLRTEVNVLQQKLKNYNRTINQDEVMVQTKYPDGRVETRVEKRTLTNEQGNASATTSTSSSTVANNNLQEHTVVTTSSKTETVTNPNFFWCTEFGFQYYNKQVLLGQGFNIGRGWTGMVLGSYVDIDDPKVKRWDIGGAVMLRY